MTEPVEGNPAVLDEAEARRAHLRRIAHPSPLNSLVASARRVTGKQVKDRRGFGKPEAWQDDAWEMYDLVGEQRFLANTLANRMAQAKFYVGRVADDPLEAPEPLDTDEHVASVAFDKFGASAAMRAQMISRMGVNLFIPGDGYFVGIPKWLLPDSEEEEPDDGGEPLTSLDDLEWKMLSVSEVTRQQDDVLLRFGEEKADQVVVHPDDIFLIRVWRPHPRRWWQADSPTRSSLGVLRELVGLTMHISAQVDSRLAGAGILVVPQSARRAIAIATGLDPDTDEDPFTEALMEAMMTAIADRSSASAVVPLVITVPDDATGLFQHITFATPLDTEARNLRDEAIRRLALGEDAPPELLLGTGGMNHWGAWLVREDVVTTHLEPPLALICDAVTTQFLWPVLIEQGMDPDEAHEYVVWYDVSHLVQRPNRLADANALHDKGVLSDDTLREAAGFGETDAPPQINRAVEIAIEMARANPALVDNMAEIIAAFEAVLNPQTTNIGTIPDAPEAGEDVIEEEQTLPDTEGADEPDQPEDETHEPSPIAAAGAPDTDTDTDTSVAIMAIPANDQDLPGPEAEKHATVLYFGHFPEQVDPSYKSLLADVVGIAARETEPFTAKVTGIEPLGDEGAKVWLLDSPDLQRLFEELPGIDSEVKSVYDDATEKGVTRYPDFTPHVTIGYETDDAATTLATEDVEEAEQVSEITFDRLALWWGDERVEFELGNPNDYEAAYQRMRAEFERFEQLFKSGGGLKAVKPPKDADADGMIDEGFPTERPNPIDALEFRPATDEDIKRLKIPRAWTEVQVNDASPPARLVAKGKDTAGRVQSRYSAEHTEAQAAKKFARMRAMHAQMSALDLALKEHADSDTARALSLIRKMGLRPGSDADTRSKVKAYGATNLLASHVVTDEDGTLRLRFTGKKGVPIDLPVTDPEIAGMLKEQAEGRAPDERLFATDERKVGRFLKDAMGNDFLTKDLRTYKANEVALNEIASLDPPTNMTGFRRQRKEVATRVSKVLGNSPAMALSSYINPAVFADWESSVTAGDFEKGLEDVGLDTDADADA